MLNRKKPDKQSIIFYRKYGSILGVKVTGTSDKILLNKISEYFRKNRHFRSKIASKRPVFITTPNPEQVVVAQNERKYKEILNSSDISLCDGVGLLAAYEYKKRYDEEKPVNQIVKILLFFKSLLYVAKNGKSKDGVLKVIKGRKFFLNLLKIANDRRYKVFLLGSTNKILRKASNRLSKKYPSVHFKTYKGATFDSNTVPLTDREIKLDRKSLRLINRFEPQMLFVAYGAPKQERWVYRNIDNLKTGLVMVVGGSFDYIAGTRKNVPQILDQWGLEWLWRLVSGSQNFQRIYNAVVKFPILVLKD